MSPEPTLPIQIPSKVIHAPLLLALKDEIAEISLEEDLTKSKLPRDDV